MIVVRAQQLGSLGFANQTLVSSMGRYRFRNQRPPKESFRILGPWGLRLSAKRLGTNSGSWILGIDWLDL